MNNIFIDTVVGENANAGSKARYDCDKILSENGYVSRYILVQKEHPYKTIFSILKLIFSIKSSSNVLIQYPLSYKLYISYFVAIRCKVKKCRLSILIHDIVWLRGRDDIKNKEIKIFRLADNIIVHNEKMQALLSPNVNKARFYILQLFDYFVDVNPHSSPFGQTVVFAGNLQKSSFLNDVNLLGIKMNLYGAKVEELKSICNDNIIYRGAFKSNDLSSILGNWGVVWDGSSTESCEGKFGEYLKYNAPHKISLYIVANLPIIIWKQAAEARFIVENKLGIAVDSLHEIHDLLEGITEAEYNEIKHNVENYAVRLRNGKNLAEVLDKIKV